MGPQLCYKKGHMTNVYLTDFDKDVIVDFVKDHEELCDKTSEHFKDKARKQSPWEEFARSRKLSVKVCKTWFDWQWTRYGKLTQSKSGQAPKEMTERQTWIQDKLRIPEVAHQTQGAQQVVSLQIASPRSQCFSYYSTRHLQILY